MTNNPSDALRCPVCGKPVENCDDTAACEDYWNARMMEADDGKSDGLR